MIAENRELKLGNERRLLTVREAAQYLAISASTLYGWVWQRRIPFVKVGRAVRFDLVELEEFVDANRVRSRSARGCEGDWARNCYNTRAAGKG
jgi:excisionase family DNA binding protein